MSSNTYPTYNLFSREAETQGDVAGASLLIVGLGEDALVNFNNAGGAEVVMQQQRSVMPEQWANIGAITEGLGYAFRMRLVAGYRYRFLILNAGSSPASANVRSILNENYQLTQGTQYSDGFPSDASSTNGAGGNANANVMSSAYTPIEDDATTVDIGGRYKVYFPDAPDSTTFYGPPVPPSTATIASRRVTLPPPGARGESFQLIADENPTNMPIYVDGNVDGVPSGSYQYWENQVVDYVSDGTTWETHYTSDRYGNAGGTNTTGTAGVEQYDEFPASNAPTGTAIPADLPAGTSALVVNRYHLDKLVSYERSAAGTWSVRGEWTPQPSAVTLIQVDDAITDALELEDDDKWNGFYPGTGGNFPAGNKNEWIIIQTSGTLNGVPVKAGEAYVCTVDDTVVGTPANWDLDEARSLETHGTGTVAERDAASPWVVTWTVTEPTADAGYFYLDTSGDWQELTLSDPISQLWTFIAAADTNLVYQTADLNSQIHRGRWDLSSESKTVQYPTGLPINYEIHHVVSVHDGSNTLTTTIGDGTVEKISNEKGEYIDATGNVVAFAAADGASEAATAGEYSLKKISATEWRLFRYPGYGSTTGVGGVTTTELATEINTIATTLRTERDALFAALRDGSVELEVVSGTAPAIGVIPSAVSSLAGDSAEDEDKVYVKYDDFEVFYKTDGTTWTETGRVPRGTNVAATSNVIDFLRNANGTISTEAGLIAANQTFTTTSFYPASEYPGGRRQGAATYRTFSRTGSEPAEQGGRYVYLSATVYAVLSDDGNVIDGYKHGLRGKGEDASAILNAMFQLMFDTRYSFNVSYSDAPYNGPIFFGGAPTISIPAGRYQLSATVVNNSDYVEVQGHASQFMPTQALLTSGEPAFNFSKAWMGYIDGLRLTGFNTAFDIKSNNIDTGLLTIRNCHFVDNSLSILAVIQSSKVRIETCRFVANDLSVDIHCDHSTITDCWISDKNERDGLHKCQILNRYGHMFVRDTITVPANYDIATGFEPAWINNYGTVQVYSCRFGAEPGSIPAVNNFTSADVSYPVTHHGVVVEHCQVNAVSNNGGGNFQPAAVRLCGDTVPNIIVVKNCTNLPDANLVDFSVNDTTVQSTVVARAGIDSTNRDEFIVDIEGNRDSFYPKDNWVWVKKQYIPQELAVFALGYDEEARSPRAGYYTRTSADAELPSYPTGAALSDITFDLELSEAIDMSAVSSNLLRFFGTQDSRGTGFEVRTNGAAANSFIALSGGLGVSMRTADLSSVTRVTVSLGQVGADMVGVMYINGAVIHSQTLAGYTLDHSNTAINVGWWRTVTTETLPQGVKVKNLKVYDSVKTIAEIDADKGKTTYLLSEHHHNDPVSVAVDKSDNGRDGSVNVDAVENSYLVPLRSIC